MTQLSRRGFGASFAACGLVALVACVAASGGCSMKRQDRWTKARPATHRVTGVVTYQGKPVEAAKVVFRTKLAETNREYAAFGYTESSGRYTLQTFDPGDGAVAGSQQVTVEKLTWSQPKADSPGVDPLKPVSTSHLPDRYASAATSGFTAEVTAKGPNAFNFVLE
jgi:hypothetical protein